MGRLWCRLLMGAGYALGNTISVSTNVTDPVLPVVTIASSAADTGVTERGSFTITVSTVENVSEDLEVTLDIPDGSGEALTFALDGGGNTLTIMTGTNSASGVINVGITSGPPGGVDADSPTSFMFGLTAVAGKYTVSAPISVLVKDKDSGDAATPLLTLTGPASVVEGETATYTVTASHTPSSLPLDVSLLVEDDATGDFLADAQQGSKTRQITAGTTTTLEVVTQADDPEGDDGTIVVSIVEGAGYALGDTISVSTNVTDPVLPVVTIASSAADTGVTERGSFTITVSTVENVSEDLEVTLDIPDGSGEALTFALDGGGNTLTIMTGTNSASGVINVGITSGPPGGVDADSPTSFMFGLTAVAGKYTVSAPISVLVKDKDSGDAATPLLTLTGPASVVEGETATYTVTAGHTPSSLPLDVSLLVEDDATGDFLADAQQGSKTRQITAGTTTTLEVVTQADDPEGDDGTIVVSIVEGAGYALGDTISVSTNVTDPVLPVVTIASSAADYWGNGAWFVYDYGING